MRLLLPILVGIVLALSPIANAQTTETHRSWTVLCHPDIAFKQHCVLQQVLTTKDTGDVVLTAMIGYPQQSDTPILLMKTPPDIQIDKGVALRVDQGRTHSFDKIHCDEDSCIIPVALDGEAITLFKRGLKVDISYVTANGQRIAMPVSLMGFTAAFNSLAAKLG